MAVRLSINEKLIIINNLATLIGAGVPILEAVDVSKNYAKAGSKKILGTMEDDLRQGNGVSVTFTKYPESFSPVTINLIKAAEESGNLDKALREVEKNLKREKDFNGKIKAALTYPLLVMAVFAVIIVVILTYVIPRVGEVFSKLKVDIPIPTKVMIALSGFFNEYLLYIGIGAMLFGVLVYLVFKYKRSLIVNMLSKLPILSKLAKLLDLTRFTHNMNTLLHSGVPITHSLELAELVVSRNDVKKAIRIARDEVSGGQSLSNGLRQSNVIPELMILLIEAGEKSGTLDKSMEELAQRYQSDSEEMLKTITTLLEPLLLVIIGGMVGGIMLSIIAPIYSLIGNIGATAGR